MSISSSERYSRQILFPGIGARGQQLLSQAQVAIVGCGATGSAAAMLLARAGVGTIHIIDRDYVEASNLQRQCLFDESDAAESLPKAIAAARKLAALNSDIDVRPHVADLTPDTIAELLSGTGLILDGADNFETRYLVNDYAVSNRVPWIYAAAVGSYAVTMNILPGETACLACFFPEPPGGMIETCDTAGILNSAAHWTASMQVAEALKILSGSPDKLRRSLLSFDLWDNIRAEADASSPQGNCRVCVQRDFLHLAGRGRPHVTLCGRNSVQIHESRQPVNFPEMLLRLQPHGKVRHNDFVLKFWRDPYELTLFPDGRAIIKGTTDTATARSLYARFIGT